MPEMGTKTKHILLIVNYNATEGYWHLGWSNMQDFTAHCCLQCPTPTHLMSVLPPSHCGIYKWVHISKCPLGAVLPQLENPALDN